MLDIARYQTTENLEHLTENIHFSHMRLGPKDSTLDVFLPLNDFKPDLELDKRLETWMD